MQKCPKSKKKLIANRKKQQQQLRSIPIARLKKLTVSAGLLSCKRWD